MSKSVLISGIGRGIGRALALEYKAAGYRVSGFDLRAEELQSLQTELGEAAGLLASCDILNSEELKVFLEVLLNKVGRIDVLVNNAGITHIAPSQETPIAAIRRLIDINLFGAIQLTQLCLAEIYQRQGSIIALGSVASYCPLLYRSAYAASKHGLWGYMTSLESELESVQVLMACPAYVDTKLQEQQGKWFSMQGKAALQSQEVAKAIVQATGTKKSLLFIGRTARLSYYLQRFFPRLFRRFMLKQTQVQNK